MFTTPCEAATSPIPGAEHRGRRRSAATFGAAAVLVAALAATAVVGHHLIGDSDPFWAYATGGWIAAHRAVPFTDPFSWTARGVPWVAHEWLFDLVLYWLSHHLGYYGLLLLVFLGLSGFAACLWLLCRAGGRNPAATSTVFVLALLLPLVSFTARPQVFGYFFFALFLYVLHWRSDTMARWLLPPAMVLWANVHGSAPLGVLMVVFEALLESWWEKRHGLWPVAGAVFLASLVNPRGLGLWGYALWMAAGNSWLRFVAEWDQPDFTSGHRALLWIFLFLLFTAVAVFAGALKEGTAPSRRGWSLTCYLAGFLFLFLSAGRYYAYFVTVWAAFTCYFLPAGWLARVRRLPVHAAQAVLLVALAAATAAPLPGPSLAAAASHAGMPVRAVDFLQARHYTGHLFNEYDWGGYLVYRGVAPFIDGRIDLYERTDVVRDYVAAAHLQKNPEQVFDKYGVQTILVNGGSPLSVFLGQSPAWTVAYRDAKSIVFTRKTAAKTY